MAAYCIFRRVSSRIEKKLFSNVKETTFKPCAAQFFTKAKDFYEKFKKGESFFWAQFEKDDHMLQKNYRLKMLRNLWRHQDDYILFTADEREFERQRDKVQAMKKSHLQYLNSNEKNLKGNELMVAYFIVEETGGAVKFKDRELWMRMNARKQHSLPRAEPEGSRDRHSVEAVDFTNSDITSDGIFHLAHLTGIRYIKFENCPHVDDLCISRLKLLSDTLEFVHISNCPLVTDNGLASLYLIRNLQGLYLNQLPRVKAAGLMAVLLEMQNPNLNVLGITGEQMKPTAIGHCGEQRRVRGLLGMLEFDPYEFVSENYIAKEGVTKEKLVDIDTIKQYRPKHPDLTY